MEEDPHPLYAQKSAIAHYGIKPSQHAPQNIKPEWVIAPKKSQDLERQLPKTSSQIDYKESLSMRWTTKLVHEWDVHDVADWLKSFISPYFKQNDGMLYNYILCFKQHNVDGKHLITKVDSQKHLRKIVKEHLHNDDINHKVIIKTIFKATKKLKKRARKEINDLHPMKQSNLDSSLKEEYMRKLTFSFGSTGKKRSKNGGNCCNIFLPITENRYIRISIMSLMLFVFALIETTDFIPNEDYGGIIAMVLFMVSTVIIIYLLCKEKRKALSRDIASALSTDQGNMDTEDLLDRGNNDRQRSKYVLSVSSLHLLAISCVLFGGFAFVASRWMKMGSNTMTMAEWLYGCGIGIYIVGLCVILVVDLAFLRLLDNHTRRMKWGHFMNFIYYLLVIGYFAIIDDSVFLSAVVLASAFVSFIVAGIYSLPRCATSFSDTCFKVILPIWILIMHVLTVFGLLFEHDMKFFPVVEDASVYGSIAFIVLASTVTLMLAIDSGINKKTPWYKA